MQLRRIEPPPERTDPTYRALWEIVDRAVGDAFARHPDYLTPHGRDKAQQSVNKRVVGALVAWLRDRR